MSEVLAAADKDLRRYARDPVALALWLGTPLLVGGLLVLAMGGTGRPAPRVHLLLADQDDSPGSRLLVSAFRHGQLGEIISAESVDQATGRARLERGDASALLIIPKGFASAVLHEEPTQLVLITNPAQRVMPRLAEELISVLGDAVFYAQRLVGPLVRELVAGPSDGGASFGEDQVARMSAAINQTKRRLERQWATPMIALATTVDERPSRPGASAVPFSFCFFPGMLLMGLLFAAQSLSDDVWREREQGVLRRLITTPMGVGSFLAGKMLATVAIMGAVTVVGLTAGMSYFHLPLVRLPLAVVWSTGTGAQLTAMLLAIQVFASSHRGASVLGYLVVFPLMMLGGSMFPFEIMPGWLSAIGRFTPNGWAVEQLTAMLLGQAGPLPLPAAFALLLLTVAGFLFVARIRMVRVFARS